MRDSAETTVDDGDSDDSLVSGLPLMGGGSGIAVFAVLAFVLVAATLVVGIRAIERLVRFTTLIAIIFPRST